MFLSQLIDFADDLPRVFQPHSAQMDDSSGRFEPQAGILAGVS